MAYGTPTTTIQNRARRRGRVPARNRRTSSKHANTPTTTPPIASARPMSISVAGEMDPTWSAFGGHTTRHSASGWPPVVTGESRTYGRKKSARTAKINAITDLSSLPVRRPDGNARSVKNVTTVTGQSASTARLKTSELSAL